ncbi:MULTISPECIES: protein UsfY [Mycolicibacterium]|nr:protein UsfY [Mycolicibacterium iranicum]
MGDRSNDPVDHARTTRKHAGQNMKNTAAMPALIGIGLAVVAFFICLFCFAVGQVSGGVVAAAIAACLAVAGFGWLGRERRRVRQVEARYVAEHPDAEPQTPTS